MKADSVSPSPRRAGGFTLVELLFVMVLLAIIATLAAPSFTNMLAKKRVEGLTAELVTDLQYARSEAVQRNQFVYVTFGPGCYVIHTGELAVGGSASCTASGPSSVTGGDELKTLQLSSGSMAQFSPNAGLTRFKFEPQRGAALSAGSVNVNSPTGPWQLRAIVTGVGRVRTCSPPGSSVTGYSDDCS